jgi:hypothetical protein
MPRTQGVDTNPKNTNREIGSYNHSLTYQGTGGGRGGAAGDVTTNRTYVLVGNYQSGSLNLFSTGTFGERGSPVASKDPNGRWQVSQTSGFTQNEIKALQTSLNSGTFGKKLNNEAKEVATRDLGADQYKRIFNPSVASTSENGSTSGGGTNPPTGSSSGGSSVSPVSSEQNKQILDTISKGEKSRTNYEKNLKYPETYDGNDYTVLEMIRYVPSKNLGLGAISSDADSGMLQNNELGLPRIDERSQNEAVLTTITLPIPANLIDANPVDWTNEGLNPLQAYGATAIGGILNSGNFLKGVGAEAGRAANTLRNNADAAKTILNNEIIKQILGVDTLTRTTGAIVNPNTELLFKGPSLRSFTFSFKMTPRNQKEAASIKKIVRTLKQGGSVKRGIRGIFLSSPNVFRVKFYYSKPIVSETGEVIGQQGKYPHPYLPILKVCALQNISVNYTPDGSYMTYGDGSMVAYDMTLTFAEISPIFDDDYDELDKELGGQNSDGNPLSQDTIIGY